MSAAKRLHNLSEGGSSWKKFYFTLRRSIILEPSIFFTSEEHCHAVEVGTQTDNNIRSALAKVVTEITSIVKPGPFLYKVTLISSINFDTQQTLVIHCCNFLTQLTTFKWVLLDLTNRNLWSLGVKLTFYQHNSRQRHIAASTLRLEFVRFWLVKRNEPMKSWQKQVKHRSSFTTNKRLVPTSLVTSRLLLDFPVVIHSDLSSNLNLLGNALKISIKVLLTAFIYFIYLCSGEFGVNQDYCYHSYLLPLS